MIVGISAVLIFFFFCPYSVIEYAGRNIDIIQDKIDIIKANIYNTTSDIKNQTDKHPSLNKLQGSLIELKKELDKTYYETIWLINASAAKYTFN